MCSFSRTIPTASACSQANEECAHPKQHPYGLSSVRQMEHGSIGPRWCKHRVIACGVMASDECKYHLGIKNVVSSGWFAEPAQCSSLGYHWCMGLENGHKATTHIRCPAIRGHCRFQLLEVAGTRETGSQVDDGSLERLLQDE